jgi:magnesium transporter
VSRPRPDPGTPTGAGGGTAGTAAGHATDRVPVAAPGDRVADVLDALRGRTFDSVAVVIVCEPGGRLAGLARVESLLAAPDAAIVGQVMDPRPVTVAPGTDQEEVARLAVEHGQAVPVVVDENGRFLGLVPAERLLGVLLEEHHEDLSRIGGLLHSAASTRAVTLETVPRRVWHRLPWLGLGLIGAMAAAGMLNAFERQLSDVVLIAFFIPGIVYLADAVGTQTEIIAIRGLSVGVSVSRIAGREMLTGLIIGALLGAVMLPLTVAVWGDARVAVAVALAVAAASIVASAVAMALPWLFNRLGRDPAFGSGPVSTVVQDLLSIVIYLGVAAALVS